MFTIHGNFFTKNLILENDDQLINETGHFRIYQPSIRRSKLCSALHIRAEHSNSQLSFLYHLCIQNSNYLNVHSLYVSLVPSNTCTPHKSDINNNNNSFRGLFVQNFLSVTKTTEATASTS